MIVQGSMCKDNEYYNKDYGLLGNYLFKTAHILLRRYDLLITSEWFSMKMESDGRVNLHTLSMVWMFFNFLATRLCYHCPRKVTSITKNLCFYIYCTIHISLTHHFVYIHFISEIHNLLHICPIWVIF